jgi:hypothetical protein
MIRGTLPVAALLGLLAAGACGEGGPEEPPPARAYPETDLSPPPLGVFLGTGYGEMLSEAPLTAEDVRGLDDALGDLAPEAESGRDHRYLLVPPLLHGIRHLYREAPWSAEETELLRAVADRLAETFEDDELRVAGTDDRAVREALLRLKTWFLLRCEDDGAFADMVATLDDGPFRGEPAEAKEAREIGRAPLGRGRGTVLFLQDADEHNPLLLRLESDRGEALWTVRVTGGEEASVTTPAGFGDPAVEDYGASGFRVNGYATWTFGTERLHAYLGPDGRLRCYFLSW